MALAHKYDASTFAARTADAADVRAAATAAVTRLNDIIANVDTYTNAQLKTALHDMAQYERALVKVVARSL